ncbi:sugar phosphate isomerase [Anaerolinea thermolimosa]|uniref:sugar phosphate isomerase/epimerase family protein n=1 Tax=Anaerolinea thermolimosa TaxID=229919 RepID=UPI000782D1D7|nr:sugar phosphate isomerase/epimerase family protein [Anaerolinea thermolimosa]GAP05984.1 sugar phosphate isomerase [Anaerolinea thermolimosa]
MGRPVTLFTGQWADLPFETICAKAKSFGYDGIEIACWGDHLDVEKVLSSDAYLRSRRDILEKHGLQCFAISNHLVGQAVCDRIDERHQSILPPRVWGDGKEDGVRRRAAEEMKMTARAAAKLGVKVVPGFTGSSIWPYLYSFPPNPPDLVEKGFAFFAEMWNPILDVFDEVGVRFALEAHPTEIAFDIASAEMAVQAVKGRPAFGFNYDPSHFGYQGVDYIAFITRFGDRIYHVHMKDVYWSDHPTEAGVFGGHLNFGDRRRFWDFRSLGRGRINFEEIIRALNAIHYQGPLSVEWEDGGMDREFGAKEACAFVRRIDFAPSAIAFDAAFERK